MGFKFLSYFLLLIIACSLVDCWWPWSKKDNSRCQKGEIRLQTRVDLSGQRIKEKFEICLANKWILVCHSDVLSKSILQKTICSSLGFKYTESEPVEKCMECYSINYERKLKEANIKAAVLSCDKNETHEIESQYNSTEDEPAYYNISLINSSYIFSETPPKFNFILLKDNLNITNTICVGALMDVTMEEKTSLAKLSNVQGNFSAEHCNTTVNFTVISMLNVILGIKSSSNEILTVTPTTPKYSQYSVVQEMKSCKSKEIGFSFVIAILTILLISMCVVALCFINRSRYRKIYNKQSNLDTHLEEKPGTNASRRHQDYEGYSTLEDGAPNIKAQTSDAEYSCLQY